MLTADLYICAMRFYCSTIMWSISITKQKYRSNAGDAISINSRRKGEEFLCFMLCKISWMFRELFLIHKIACIKIFRLFVVKYHDMKRNWSTFRSFIEVYVRQWARNCVTNVLKIFIISDDFFSSHFTLLWLERRKKADTWEAFWIGCVVCVCSVNETIAFNDLQLQSQEFSQFK